MTIYGCVRMQSPFHLFRAARMNLPDDAVLRAERLPDHSAITDASLPALACVNGGRLVTFDRLIPLRAVSGARPERVPLVRFAQKHMRDGLQPTGYEEKQPANRRLVDYSFPNKQRLNHRLVEFGIIDPQGHVVRSVKGVPAPG